jgi:hypothetical protein
MRALTLAALLVAGCTGSLGTTPSQATPDAITASAAPTVATTTAPPTASPTASAAVDVVYTADDEQIAKLIEAGADEAITQLRLLNDMDPDKLEDLFVPLGTWITAQRAGIEALTPSSCTASAVTAFMEGMDAYDSIREKFLAWRDWGAHGHAFPPGAPREAAAMFETALLELEAHCAG